MKNEATNMYNESNFFRRSSEFASFPFASLITVNILSKCDLYKIAYSNLRIYLSDVSAPPLHHTNHYASLINDITSNVTIAIIDHNTVIIKLSTNRYTVFRPRNLLKIT